MPPPSPAGYSRVFFSARASLDVCGAIGILSRVYAASMFDINILCTSSQVCGGGDGDGRRTMFRRRRRCFAF